MASPIQCTSQFKLQNFLILIISSLYVRTQTRIKLPAVCLCICFDVKVRWVNGLCKLILFMLGSTKSTRVFWKRKRRILAWKTIKYNVKYLQQAGKSLASTSVTYGIQFRIFRGYIVPNSQRLSIFITRWQIFYRCQYWDILISSALKVEY